MLMDRSADPQVELHRAAPFDFNAEPCESPGEQKQERQTPEHASSAHVAKGDRRPEQGVTSQNLDILRVSKLAGRDSEPDIIDGPDSVAIKFRTKRAFDFGDSVRAQEARGEHFEPIAQARFSFDRSGAWEKDRSYSLEAVALQQSRILGDAR